jgi:hypothetical protein
MASRGIKCSAIKQTANGSITECVVGGRIEYDWFCCMEHQVDAKKYAGEQAFNAHINRVSMVAKNKSLYHTYNSQIRPAFASILVAGKRKEEAEFIMSVGMEYTQQAKDAWAAAETVMNTAGANELKTMTDEVTATQQNVKRKQTEDINLSKLFEKDEGSPTKKNKQVSVPIINLVQRGERILRSVNLSQQQPSIPSTSTAPVPPATQINEQERTRIAAEMQNAANIPLPDEDDDLNEDGAPMSS